MNLSGSFCKQLRMTLPVQPSNEPSWPRHGSSCSHNGVTGRLIAILRSAGVCPILASAIFAYFVRSTNSILKIMISMTFWKPKRTNTNLYFVEFGVVPLINKIVFLTFAFVNIPNEVKLPDGQGRAPVCRTQGDPRGTLTAFGTRGWHCLRTPRRSS
jgi:hypothetical protein